MLARLNSCLEVQRAKAWRGCQDHQVHAAVQHLFVCVQPDELAFLIHIDLALTPLGHRSQAAIQPIAENLAHGPELHVAVCRERLRCRACAAATTADEADLQFAAVGFAKSHGGKSDGACCHGGCTAGLDEFTSVGRCFLHGLVVV